MSWGRPATRLTPLLHMMLLWYDGTISRTASAMAGVP